MENLNLKHRCYQYESTGKIIYNPVRQGKTEPWFALLEVDQDLGDYYRLQFLNEFKIALVRPNWKPHITIFKGELEYTPQFDAMWKERDGEEVNFVYGTEIFWNSQFVWINTYFPEYFELREKAGLTHEDNGTWGHITIGKFRTQGQIPSFVDYSYPKPQIDRCCLY